jgi:hypothetical protein
LIKDEFDEHVLYSTKEESPRYAAKRRHLYRGDTETGDRIATIECFSENACLVQMHDTEQYIPIRSEGRYVRECFEYDNEKFSWSGMKELMNEDGVVIAKLKAPFFSWTNIGELTIMDMTERKQEVVLATFTAIH